MECWHQTQVDYVQSKHSPLYGSSLVSLRKSFLLKGASPKPSFYLESSWGMCVRQGRMGGIEAEELRVQGAD